MKIIVQKFGGTSVANQEFRDKIAKKVISKKEDGYKVIVVVSAIGRKGSPFATDTLIDFYKSVNEEENTRTLDLIMSCGENISASILVNTIKKYNGNARVLTGFQAGIITNDNFGNADILEINSEKIKSYFSDYDILVVTGFQGITKDGDITTLGRGGSDNTAASIGLALEAEIIEIYTDVDGVMTADPRKVEDAKLLDELSYEETYQMARDGAKVVDHKAIKRIKNSNSILKIKNFFSEAKNGSTIMPQVANFVHGVKAVVDQNKLCQLRVESKNHSSDKIIELINSLALERSFISKSQENIIITVFNENLIEIKEKLDKYGLEYSLTNNCGKVSLIAKDIYLKEGIITKAVLVLVKNNIDILQIQDSHLTITFIVKEIQLNKTLNLLHRAFTKDIK